MATMHVLGRHGDSELRWNPAQPRSVARAQRRFARYQQGGYLAFSAREPGGEATHIREFDPEAEEIVLTRPLMGG